MGNLGSFLKTVALRKVNVFLKMGGSVLVRNHDDLYSIHSTHVKNQVLCCTLTTSLLGKQKHVDPGRLLVSQSSMIGEFQVAARASQEQTNKHPTVDIP